MSIKKNWKGMNNRKGEAKNGRGKKMIMVVLMT